MSDTPAFGTQVIGQTEKALNAILDRMLAGTGLTEPQWVTLTLAAASGGTLGRDQLISRMAGALKVRQEAAQERITELAAAQLVHAPADDGSPVQLTDAGQQLYSQVRTAVTDIIQRLWGDLPAEDLATAGRVLNTVTTRAN